MRRRLNKPAFTLIELLVIILIIAIVGSVIVPAYAQFWARARFDAMLREIKDQIAYAREQAVQGDTTSTVVYDPGSQSLIASVAPPPPQTDIPAALIDPQQTNGMPTTPVLPRTLQITGDFAVAKFQTGAGTNALPMAGAARGGTEFHFRGDGTTEGADIMLVSVAGYTSRIIVWPSTGRISIEDQ